MGSRRLRGLGRSRLRMAGRRRGLSPFGLSADLGQHAQCLERGQIDLWLSKSGSLKQLSAAIEAHRAASTGKSPSTPAALPLPLTRPIAIPSPKTPFALSA